MYETQDFSCIYEGIHALIHTMKGSVQNPKSETEKVTKKTSKKGRVSTIKVVSK